MQFRKPCVSPHCRELATHGAYCEKHRPKEQCDKSDEWHYLYNNAKWREARLRFLIQHYACAECAEVATVVDHIIPHRGNPQLFWDKSNWQVLCKSCHDKKTAFEVSDRRNKWQQKNMNIT